ncbi:MAG: aminoacyl-tRNA hydrolase [Desulfobulbus propionicus]|nr:MAG: aminoacyl-tRNA hydrolase [Desulfobulbus propionicus]
MDGFLQILPNLSIPLREVNWSFSRSSGRGGQNVNKVNTRVTLLFDLTQSQSLSARQQQLLRSRLAGRINHEGVLRIIAGEARTQHSNRQLALRRFQCLLAQALTVRTRRVPTKPGRAVKERRRRNKIYQSQRKSSRSWRYSSE